MYGDNFAGQYRADGIRPEPIPHHENPPIYKQVTTLNTGNPDLRRQPNFRFWIHQPTIRFPETTCFIGFTAGGRSTFTRITRDSVEQLALWLAEVLRDSQTIYDASVDEESSFSDSVTQTARVQDRIAQKLQELRTGRNLELEREGLSGELPRRKSSESKGKRDNTGKS